MLRFAKRILSPKIRARDDQARGDFIASLFVSCSPCGAASYIAVPAVQRLAIPEASPTLPLAASLGLTFTYNVTIGIPVYIMLAKIVTTQFPVVA